MELLAFEKMDAKLILFKTLLDTKRFFVLF